MSDGSKFIEIYNKLISQFTQGFIDLADPVVREVVELLHKGEDVATAITTALDHNNFFGRQQVLLTSILYKSVEVEIQTERPGYKIKNPNEIKRQLLHEAWAPDGMSLSARLHGSSIKTRNSIIDTIRGAMKRADTVKEMSLKLFDGYNSGSKVIREAELPQYLKTLETTARHLVGGDLSLKPDYDRLLKNARRMVDKMSADGAPNQDLKMSYQQLLDSLDKFTTDTVSPKQEKRLRKQLKDQGMTEAVDLAEAIANFNESSLNSSVNTAIQEKSRYVADRIARTESARAWADAFFAETLNDDDVIAYQYSLSSGHNIYDICDLHANADLYGLGKGIYPKDSMPPYPAHSHCHCILHKIIEGHLNADFQKENEMLGSAKFDSGQMVEYLDSLSDSERRQLLGIKGTENYEKTGNWKENLKNWQGQENPRSRLKASDFGSQTLPQDNLIIRQQLQNRHIEGTKEYQKYLEQLSEKNLKPGLITYSHPQELVNNYAGKGRTDIYPDGSKKETVITDDVIGKYWNYQKQEYLDTKALKIVYSKKGTHIYPVWDGTKEGF